MKEKQYVRALTIAGSDSGGGAGIQADLKTFSALGCYGMTAITSITAQNTIGVQEIYDLSPGIIEKQITSILDDIGVDVIKIGMLHRSEIINVISLILSSLKNQIPIVVDPVMVSKSGHHLLNDEATDILCRKIFPFATIITPNLPEASRILGINISSPADMEWASKELSKMGPKAVVIKGGHLEEEPSQSNDCLWEEGQEDVCWFQNQRIHTMNTHGTGCTFSAAIAAYLGKKKSIKEAVSLSKFYLSHALSAGAEYPLGRGHGPVHHFFDLSLNKIIA